MYNRYIPAGSAYQPLEEDGGQDAPAHSGPLEGVGDALSGLLKRFHLSHMDSGDLLLLLILLLLVSDGEDRLDWIIVLGLAVAFGFFRRDDQPEAP